jgi:hypothetical protein
MHVRTLARLAAASAVALATLGTGTPAQAALPPVTLSADTIPFDGSVTISGSGCDGLAASVAVSRGGVAYWANPPTDDEGRWSMAFDRSLFTVPEFAPGLFTVHSRCNDYGTMEDYSDVEFVVMPAAGDPELDGPLTVTPASVPAGGKVTVTAEDMTSMYDVSVFLFSAPVFVGNLPVAQLVDGVATLEVTIPPDTPTGPHQLVAYGSTIDAQARVLGAAITVTAATAPGPAPAAGSDTLPATGQSSWPYVGLGIFLVSSGVAFTTAGARVIRRPKGAHFAR